MPVLKTEKTHGFTVLDNTFLRDKNLSLKAKGILSLMLSLPPDWEFSEAGLTAICKEGKDSVHSALKELESCGYIMRERVRNEKGRVTSSRYTVSETPVFEKPVKENPKAAKPKAENPQQLNKEIINKDIQNKDVSNTYRISSYETIGLDEYRAYLKLIKKNISYETLCRRRKHEIPKIDGICDLLCRTLCSKRESIVISAESYPADLVKSRLLKLHDGHVLYVLDCMSENTAHIRNIKKYILAALFNAPSTIDAYYEAKANELSNM